MHTCDYVSARDQKERNHIFIVYIIKIIIDSKKKILKNIRSYFDSVPRNMIL